MLYAPQITTQHCNQKDWLQLAASNPPKPTTTAKILATYGKIKKNRYSLSFCSDPLLLQGNVVVLSCFWPCKPDAKLIPTNNRPVVVFLCIFSIFVGWFLNMPVFAPLWNYSCCLLVLATSSNICKTWAIPPLQFIHLCASCILHQQLE